MSVPKLMKPVEEAVVKQIASLALLGKSQTEIANTLNIGPGQTRKIMAGEKFKDLMKEYGDEAVANAKNMLKARAEKLAPEVWSTLERLIRSDKGRDNAEALKLYFRLIGLEKHEEASGAGTLNILLPGATAQSNQVIDVTPEGDEDEQV